MDKQEILEKAQKKKDNKTLVIVIIAGFFCPLIWIIYGKQENLSV